MARRGHCRPPAEMPARTPVACTRRARRVNNYHQCTGQRRDRRPHSLRVVGSLTPERNLADLVQHAEEFEQRVAFAYTVLAPDGDDVIGCLYLDPGPTPGSVDVRSWVRADVADLDRVLRAAVREWLDDAWPFEEIVYAG